MSGQTHSINQRKSGSTPGIKERERAPIQKRELKLVLICASTRGFLIIRKILRSAWLPSLFLFSLSSILPEDL